jgi:hypothetical protein
MTRRKSKRRPGVSHLWLTRRWFLGCRYQFGADRLEARRPSQARRLTSHCARPPFHYNTAPHFD